MGDFVKKLQDPAFRQKVIAAYVDDSFGITSQECGELGAGYYDCFLEGERALMAVLPPDEKDRVLRARARWLGERLDMERVHRYLHGGLNEGLKHEEREEAYRAYKIWEALKELGPYARPWFQPLLAELTGPFTGLVVDWEWEEKLSMAWRLTSDPFSLASAFARICLGKDGDTADLVAGLSLEFPQNYCSGNALSYYGALSVPAEGVGLIRRIYFQIPEQRDFFKKILLNLLSKLGQPTGEALLFLEEIYQTDSDYFLRRDVQKLFAQWGRASLPSIFYLIEEGKIPWSEIAGWLEGTPLEAEDKKTLIQSLVRMDVRGDRGTHKSWPYHLGEGTLAGWAGAILAAYEEEGNPGRRRLLGLIPSSAVDRRFLPIVLQDFQGPDDNLREAVSDFLLRTGLHSEAVPFLLDFLPGTAPEPVRKSAWKLFRFAFYTYGEGKIPSASRVLVALTRLLEDPNPVVRRDSAGVLSDFKGDGVLALPLLYTMSRNDADEACREAARFAMEKIESGVL